MEKLIILPIKIHTSTDFGKSCLIHAFSHYYYFAFYIRCSSRPCIILDSHGIWKWGKESSKTGFRHQSTSLYGAPMNQNLEHNLLSDFGPRRRATGRAYKWLENGWPTALASADLRILSCFQLMTIGHSCPAWKSGPNKYRQTTCLICRSWLIVHWNAWPESYEESNPLQ